MPTKNLLDCRRRYVRMLDSLCTHDPVDDRLRGEIEETIGAIDQKLSRHAGNAVHEEPDRGLPG